MYAIRSSEITLKSTFASFLETRKSANTRNKYEYVIQLFSKLVYKKPIEEVDGNDLSKLKYSVVYKDFIKTEREEGIKDSTIKVYINIVSSFLDYIGKEDVFPDLNINKIKVNSLNSQSLINDETHIKPMSKKDLEQLKSWLIDRKYLSHDERIGEKYAALVDFMFVTAIRSSAVFKIKWSQFEVIKDSDWGGDFAKLTVVDKGNKRNIKFLPLNYYRELEELFYHSDDNELIFKGLTKINLINYMKKFSKETGKNITPHSIKVGAGTYVYSITKDIVKTSRFLDHSSIETTMKYIRDNGNPNETGSVIASREYDYSKLNDLTKEELLLIIKGREELKNVIYNDALQSELIKL
jgi:integrase